jgi:hypothetical protein
MQHEFDSSMYKLATNLEKKEDNYPLFVFIWAKCGVLSKQNVPCFWAEGFIA